MFRTTYSSQSLHLRNLLTHTLLLWHFLENLNFEFKNILEYIRTMFSGDACIFLETSDLELLKYGSLTLEFAISFLKVLNIDFPLILISLNVVERSLLL